ncbi:hypothetical protein C8A00DRAFT_31975 [Chaetomidium leptoderma]|uniref:ribonuclease Z n=1 Tax=Chaetomidium leptoderma TaxID=669021 RepID=A0AAN6VP33_9PEZI|nr:hypothetical protein C8A00DRAFT_31975 [Chaetomidium leptoderma]
MYAAATKVERVSPTLPPLLQTLPSRSPLHNPLHNPLRLHSAPFARCFRFVARPERKPTRPSPLVQFHTPRAPLLVPKSLFPGITARPVRGGWHNKQSGTLRFILTHNSAVAARRLRNPPTTLLHRPTGMLCYVQIVSTPTADTPGACLMLHFDNRRYLFGRMAEGTQRTMVQRKLSLAKIHDIFLTGSIDWEATGGLLGLILTLADLKASSAADIQVVNEKLRNKGKKDLKSVLAHLNIHGGKNLVHMLATARRFILRKALPVHPREVRHDPRLDASAEPDYEDENIRVWSIPLVRGEQGLRADQPKSSKKRRLSLSDSSEASAAEKLATEEADQNARGAVVEDMFSSKWKLDTLREMRLADVQLPAKLFVRNAEGHLEPYSGPGPSECPDTNVFVRMPWPAAKIERLPPTEPSNQSMSYIVKCHSRRGKFDPGAATSLGVVKTDFRKLTAGESVPGKDGSVVTPEMVIGAQIEGHGFAVIDIGSADLIPALLSRDEFKDPTIMEGIDTMYWILSDDAVIKDADLQRFIKERPSIKHIVLDSGVCPNVPALESPTSQLIKMNRVDEKRFPLPVFDTKPMSELDEELKSMAEAGRAGLKFQLAPKPGFLTDTVVPVMDTGKPIWELATHTPQVLDLATVARKVTSGPAFSAEVDKSQQDLPDQKTEIIPLGTGSAMPSKYRNVSATLIRTPEWGNYLLDCGENTLGQLRRSFGYEGADAILRDLRAIYISHAHADHHLGTISVISRWSQLTTTSKLAIIATPKYQEFVREFQQVQELSPDRLVQVALRSAGGRPQPGSVGYPHFHSDAEAASIKLPHIEACFVDHCFEATALVLTFPDTGLKIAYSGDCRPSRAFAKLGKGAHLLIHECTFEDELAGDALAKKHSTLSEALDVGRQMEARRILLTHFSQRYPKLPVVPEAALKTDGKRDVEVLFAFDMMRVELGGFKEAKQYLPALRELLRDGEQVEEDED